MTPQENSWHFTAFRLPPQNVLLLSQRVRGTALCEEASVFPEVL